MQQYPLLQTKLYSPPVRPDPSTGLRARLVSRPRLLERLNAGLQRKLTLISAPAGFGKTTLASEWAHKVGAHSDAPQVAWLSLDEGDNDPTRFLAYVIAALQMLPLSADGTSGVEEPVLSGVEGTGARQEPASNIGKGMLSALCSPQPPPAEAVLTSLINEIAALPDKIILVLDDYHLIEVQPVHDALAFLLEHLPPPPGGRHLVIATREDPLLPLARLRARGQLTELRASDLRFASSEAAEFLNRVMGLGLSAADIAALETRTEGWIAGLHLAAISMQGHKDTSTFIKSFTGSHRFVLDYLMEEVMAQQPDNVQAFLLQTAILDRLTGPLCDAVRSGLAGSPSTPEGDAVYLGHAEAPTAQDNGQATLEMLERANLFIVPLDEERRWYRYHHLFSDLLRRRLRQTQPDRVPTLHRRASEWYEQNEFVGEAIEHALRAEDFERATHLIEGPAEAVWVRGDDIKLRRWLDGLPVDLMSSKPLLCIFHAWSLFATGRQGMAERCLQVAEQTLEPSTGRAAEDAPMEQERLPGAGGMKLRGRAAATRAYFCFYRGDVPGLSHYSRQALEYLPEQDLAWRCAATNVLGDAHDFKGEMAAAYQVRLEALKTCKAAGNNYQVMIANLKLAVNLRHLGRLQRVIEICQQQLQLAHERGMSQTVVVGWLLAIWGEALAELNDLDGAVEQARKGVELTERGGEMAMLGWSYQCLTRVLFARGELTGAKEIIQKMESTAREYDVPPWITNLMAAWQARIWLAEDKLDAVAQWAQERGLNIAGDLTCVREMEVMVLARLLIAQGRLDEATKLLQRLLETVEPRGHTSREIEILSLQALASQAAGEPGRAMTTLERALTLAEPGGSIRIFVDEGPPMARLLEQLRRKRVTVDYIMQILAAFETTDGADAGIADAGIADAGIRAQTTQTALDPSSALVEALSERELKVLQLVAEGLTNQEIASRLFLSLNTVKAHTRNIYGKLGVHSRTQAVARARALGLLPFT